MTPTNVTIQGVGGPAAATGVLMYPARRTNDTGWTETPLPNRQGFPEWAGKPLDRLVVAVAFDRWDVHGSVERDVEALRGFTRPTRNGPPPRVTCRGPEVPTRPGEQWVVEAIEWGEETLCNPAGQVSRQDATITLMQSPAAAPGPAKARLSSRPRTITLTQSGDTMQKLAKRDLDSEALWTVIKRLNPGLGAGKPSGKIKAGRVVILP